jgi:UDP-N-acetylglucosamine acyltransferase
VFREQVSVHRGTDKGGGATRIADRCLLMVGAHVAHDCSVGSDVVLTNLATLGGHVVVESSVVCGGHVAVAPFVHLGRGCFVAGGAKVERDVPPFMIAQGDRARVRALNRVGLERLGTPEPSRAALAEAFRLLWRSKEPLAVALERVHAQLGEEPLVAELVAFLRPRLPSLSVVDRASA